MQSGGQILTQYILNSILYERQLEVVNLSERQLEVVNLSERQLEVVNISDRWLVLTSADQS